MDVSARLQYGRPGCTTVCLHVSVYVFHKSVLSLGIVCKQVPLCMSFISRWPVWVLSVCWKNVLTVAKSVQSLSNEMATE